MRLNGPRGAVFAPGDTLSYTISGPAGAGSSSYDFTVSASATNGTWSIRYGSATQPFQVLPASGNTGTGGAWLINAALTAATWDSASFRYVMRGRNSRGVSADSLVLTWSIRRLPHAPPTGTIDSSKAQAILVKPDSIKLLLAGSRIACAFLQFSNGGVARPTADAAACDSISARSFSAAQRSAVTVAQQRLVDSTAASCVVWSTSAPSAIGLVPRAACSGAVTVTGLGLTLRMQAPSDAVIRYASLPVGMVTRTGLATCIRPGTFLVRAVSTIDGGQITWLQPGEPVPYEDRTRVGSALVRCSAEVPQPQIALQVKMGNLAERR